MNCRCKCGCTRKMVGYAENESHSSGLCHICWADSEIHNSPNHGLREGAKA
ncbi:hypothetical protein LCGC14_0429750 [marine sediment metagenome]|uniref:Uncharacterized protein n=1 Tax=marine sediment metagenome TaxID=412755 RepID=A0A0F9SUI6_9ZZZZ